MEQAACGLAPPDLVTAGNGEPGPPAALDSTASAPPHPWAAQVHSALGSPAAGLRALHVLLQSWVPQSPLPPLCLLGRAIGHFPLTPRLLPSPSARGRQRPTRGKGGGALSAIPLQPQEGALSESEVAFWPPGLHPLPPVSLGPHTPASLLATLETFPDHPVQSQHTLPGSLPTFCTTSTLLPSDRI